MFESGCLKCSHKTIYKYHLCESCYSNLRLDVIWDREMEYIDKVVVGGEYVGLLREIILDYKFNDKVYYSKTLAELLLEKLFLEKLHREYNYITYVPMYLSDLHERGYNQSSILADIIAKEALLNFVEPIQKIKQTKKQIDVTSIDRKNNLKNAFVVASNVPEKIIIVDDVITTGSTLDEIGKSLKENGVKKVAALVAATHNI